MKNLFLCLALAAPVACLAAERVAPDRLTVPPPWRGVHLMAPDGRQLPLVQRAIREKLAPLGVNLIVLEVNYRFAWRSHPDLADGGAITWEQARAFAEVCREHRMRLVPLFNCLGHQSWAARTAPLLTRHPEFDETPRIPADNRGIYCRSWCPQHPVVNTVVFALMDELLEAFAADALHVGMDEVFLIGHEQCDRCRGQDPAKLFARAVNDYHRHLVGRRKVEMMLWGDRLLDDTVMNYGEWEASRNGTAGAVDLIPKDIIICDWHYEPRAEYPSVPFFQEKGFRVLPSSWRNRDAALALLDYARAQDRGKVVGHLGTTWSGADAIARALLGEGGEPPGQVRQIVAALEACLKRLAGD
ncbi:MAG: family 20 glycosylhydrolase [Verrucomicrobia bacterium]|nr:family 20 glycosylhydrolase [Verrucomicrobiota bacterium]